MLGSLPLPHYKPSLHGGQAQGHLYLPLVELLPYLEVANMWS